MKNIIIISLLLVLFSCKKEEVTVKKNVFSEIAGPAKYRVEIVDENKSVLVFDSVELGWNWQKEVEVGKFIAIEAKKLTMLDSATIDVARLYVKMEIKREVIDTGKTKTISVWAKVE